MRTFLLMLALAVGLQLTAHAAHAGPSIQLEAGVMEMKNPMDDQYVLYHAGPGFSFGDQMTSPVLGIAIREDAGPLVLTIGYRDMGHQYIDTDITPDATYFNCRYKNTCPKPIERWYARMSMQEVYASAGYRFHVAGFGVVPTVGIAEERMPTSIEVTFPYGYLPGRKPEWFVGNHQDQPHSFVGLDVERGRYGLGVYLLSTNHLPTNMGDPGQGNHAFLTRFTARFF